MIDIFDYRIPLPGWIEPIAAIERLDRHGEAEREPEDDKERYQGSADGHSELKPTASSSLE